MLLLPSVYFMHTVGISLRVRENAVGRLRMKIASRLITKKISISLLLYPILGAKSRIPNPTSRFTRSAKWLRSLHRDCGGVGGADVAAALPTFRPTFHMYRWSLNLFDFIPVHIELPGAQLGL